MKRAYPVKTEAYLDVEGNEVTAKGKHTPGPRKVYHAALRPQLMGAAPDMLDVLLRIDATFSRLQATEEEEAIFDALDAAIAKAEGNRISIK